MCVGVRWIQNPIASFKGIPGAFLLGLGLKPTNPDVSPPDGRIDDGLITMAMHPSLRVCVSAKFAEHPIARCEVLIPGMTFPVGWLDLPLRATATVFNAE
jgi:hypothetical protein|tara:strand:- start:282 stop:581 length:300 start_codon:yes stop_codon:yes gene_type:complete